MTEEPWQGPAGIVARAVAEHSQRSLDVYRADPRRVDEDAGQEEDLATGGYGRRQVFELVQNGADEMIEQPGGRIQVLLNADALYCANEGSALKPSGVTALMHAHVSSKRADEIGRFGLGFKSVLGVTRNPRFYSRSASFVFDADEAERRIREIVGEREQYPVLRVATTIDPEDDARKDDVLASLLEWATTVVKLPLNVEASWLSDDLDKFPAEFLLFSPHVGALELRNELTGVHRLIRLDRDAGGLMLLDGDDVSLWKVFSKRIKPTEQAKQDAGKLAARDELPLEWAIPIDGRIRTGRFWAFFPLRDETTLSGIANAPWQINDDRTGLLETSRLNEELLDAFADLVVSSIEALQSPSDPGWVLDVLPARGRESRSWGDEFMSIEVFKRLAQVACIPDLTGRLRRVSEVRIPPQPTREPLREALEFWAKAPHPPTDWCHPSAVSNTNRRARVERLLEAEKLRARPLSEWLESVMPQIPTVPDSEHAIRLAGMLTDSDEGFRASRDAVRYSAIVLLDSEDPKAVTPASVHLANLKVEEGLGLATVHPDLADDPEIRALLERFGVPEVSPELQLEHCIDRMDYGGSSNGWERAWSIVRTIPDAYSAVRVLAETSRDITPRVRVASGAWHECNLVLMPGLVADPSRDPEVAADTEFHAGDLEVLRALGVAPTPEAGYPASRDPFVKSYLHACYEQYVSLRTGSGSTPNESWMEFAEAEVCGPLAPLRLLGEEGRAEFTATALASSVEWGPWTLRHATQPYPEMQFVNPVLLALRSEGRLRTSVGIRSIEQCVGAGFLRWSETLPVVDLGLEHEALLGIPSDLDAVSTKGEIASDFWQALCTQLESATDDGLIGAFFAEACLAGLPRPEQGIWCRAGDLHRFADAEHVAVCDNLTTFRALRDMETPAILVPERRSVDDLVTRWGMRRTEEDVRTEPVWTQSAANRALADYFPLLRDDLRDRGLLEFEVVPCSELALEVSTSNGKTTEDVPFLVLEDERRLLWLSNSGAEGLLRQIMIRYSLELDEEEVDDVVHQRVQQEMQEKLSALRALSNLGERLVKALGPAVLRGHLPIGLLAAVEAIHGPADDLRLADLVLAVHGYDALRSLRVDLDAAGFSPPARWAGSWEARQFVRGLGFPDEFAGFRGTSRDSQLFVPGPSDLPSEHEYQREIIERIHELVGADEKSRRGLLSLPTGAGKTRVAVQGLVEAIARGTLASPVLWIAQSDELCEQAVQAWAEVWRRYGTADDFTISRLWGPNEVEQSLDGPQAVVATVDKLRFRVDDDSYDWLRNASCVVVDEAHTATAPEYTTVLEWAGILTRGATTRTRCPLVGLTATPFRGRSVEETRRLVNRFGRRRLDSDEEDPYRSLQQMGVLAAVEGEVLEGAFVEVSEDEASQFERLRDMPRDVYRRIASDVERNQRLLSSIRSKPADWPILVFAISIEHAQTLAALLRLEGVPAVSIDHETDSDLRRRYVEEFRKGDIRVICNYSVLTQGFDAPAVRAIYVTRPTFSPNVYQQMIGRGLRGPRNRGTDRCLIVNVADNWQRFGDQLAFRDFEYLWRET